MENSQIKPREKDERIVWQNQSHLALEILKSKGRKVSVSELCRLTDALTLWCVQGRNPELLKTLTIIDNILDGKEKE